jgi:predicted Fe-S protein YdhL (DUF1289 family)
MRLVSAVFCFEESLLKEFGCLNCLVCPRFLEETSWRTMTAQSQSSVRRTYHQSTELETEKSKKQKSKKAKRQKGKKRASDDFDLEIVISIGSSTSRD